MNLKQEAISFKIKELHGRAMKKYRESIDENMPRVLNSSYNSWKVDAENIEEVEEELRTGIEFIVTKKLK